MSYSAEAAMSNIRLGGLSNRSLFTLSSGGWKIKIKILKCFVSVEDSPLACRWHLSAVSSQDMGKGNEEKEREGETVCPLVFLLIKTLNLWDQGPSFMTSF